jgi:hypothetical protein
MKSNQLTGETISLNNKIILELHEVLETFKQNIKCIFFTGIKAFANFGYDQLSEDL